MTHSVLAKVADHTGLVASMRRDPQSDGVTGCARTLYCLGRGVSLINREGHFSQVRREVRFSVLQAQYNKESASSLCLQPTLVSVIKLICL